MYVLTLLCCQKNVQIIIKFLKICIILKKNQHHCKLQDEKYKVKVGSAQIADVSFACDVTTLRRLKL